MTRSSLVRIVLHGRVSCSIAGEEVVRFSTSKTALLLAKLALNIGKDQSREELCEMIWPDADLDSARINLRQSLASLRRHLETDTLVQGSVIISDKRYVRLDSTVVATDVEDFRRLVSFALSGSVSTKERIDALERAVSISSGELLKGYYEDWVIEERNAALAARASAMKTLATLCQSTGRFDSAIGYLSSLSNDEPYDEDTHKSLFSLLLATGQRKAAGVRYRAFQRRFALDLRREPSFRLNDLSADLTCVNQPSAIPAVDAASVPEAQSSGKAPDVSAQVSDDGGPAIFGLPIYRDRFFGRTDELAQLSTWLSDPTYRLMSLVGPGGSGKSRLSVECVRALASPPFDTIAFIHVVEESRPEALAVDIARSIGLIVDMGKDTLDRLAHHVAGQRILIVLDNFERPAMAEGVAVVSSILSALPTCRVLVTSRIALDLDTEHVLAVEPLDAPDLGSDTTAAISPNAAATFASVALFRDRVRLVKPDFAINAGNAQYVSAICSRLDGLPLAIELAAALGKSYSPRQMYEHLSRPYEVLVRSSSKSERHRSLARAVLLSYQSLSTELQEFFCSLFVFTGTFDVAAARDVSRNDAAEELLEHLAKWSMVRRTTDEQGVARYRLLETLKEFGSENLTIGQRDAVRTAHFRTFISRGSQVVDELGSSNQAECLKRLDGDIASYRQVVAYGRTRPQLVQETLGFVLRLRNLWETRGFYSEVLDDLSVLTAACRSNVNDCREVYIEALFFMASIYHMQSEESRAARVLEEALDVGKDIMTPDQYATNRRLLATVYTYTGKINEAHALILEALQRSEEANDLSVLANARLTYGLFLASLDRFTEADSTIKLALAYAREAADQSFTAWCLHFLACTAHFERRFIDCRDYTAEALSITQSTGDKALRPFLLYDMACMANDVGNTEEARRSLVEALDEMISFSLRWAQAYVLDECAYNAILGGHFDTACRLFGCVESFRIEIGSYLPGCYLPRKRRYLERLVAMIGEPLYSLRYKEGTRMSLPAAAREFKGLPSSPDTFQAALLALDQLPVGQIGHSVDK